MSESVPTIRPEVKAAVDDIINGTSVDSHTEWLLREYNRMMHREAKMKSDLGSRQFQKRRHNEHREQPNPGKHWSSP